MEADVTEMASGSISASDFQKHCVTCGTFGFWASRVWDCDVCEDYFMCDSCYKRSVEDCEVLLAPPQAHNHDHCMSPLVPILSCVGCNSWPIWNQRWRCKVCLDIDLCEECYGGLDAANMPPGHSKDHPMISVEVLSPEDLLEFQPSFSKPVDPQWSYMVYRESSDSCGFEWEKRKPLAEIFSSSQMSAVEDGKIIQTSPKTDGNNSGHISKVEKLKRRSLAVKEPSETTPTQRIFDERFKIFLSHAGTEKDFVEQLYVDLSRVHHFGIFFDKDDASLPKGEPFPERIFDAAMHCELAIVVISEEYFVRKWPMLELAAFVKAQKVRAELKKAPPELKKARPEPKILPVFYKLTVKEFKQRKQFYVEKWTQMPRISEDDIQLWKEALEVISRTNGIEYDKKGEVPFREKIVEKVCKRVKPVLLWDDSHVQGKARIHGMIEEKIQLSSFVENNMAEEVQSTHTVVGLYGMGGSGKTTLCKVLCNEMMQCYLGRVYYIEFGSMDILKLRKKLLQSMSLSDGRALKTIDAGQALYYLKHYFPNYKVCLIIDNVSDNQASIEEAKTLLKLPFKKGSLILVTSRSRIVLQKLRPTVLMRMPALTKNEAEALFCHHADCNTSSLLGDQKKTMENFVERCNFKAEDMASREYHPLALKVLGTRVGPIPEEWDNIRINFKYYENENTHDVFSILRSSYDALLPQHQRMFLDIALNKGNYSKHTRDLHMRWQMRCLYNARDELFISIMVKDLQAKSLVEFYDAKDGIYIHELYRKFATMEVEKRGLQHSRSCCLSRGSYGQHPIQEGRVRIQNEEISQVTKDILSCKVCSDAQLLTIEGCPNLKSVDVPGMQNLQMFEVFGDCPQLTSVNLEGAVNLQCCIWYGFVGEFPNLISWESLEGLWLGKAEEESSPPTLNGSLDFSKSSKLEVLNLPYLPLNLLNLNQAVKLKAFHIGNCQYLDRFEGIEALVKLEELILHDCFSLLEFPSLANFPSLETCVLEGAARLKEIQGVGNLTALEQLSLNGGSELEKLPGIEACTRLSWLDLSYTNMEDFSWISVMKDLTFIDLSGTKIRFVPDCSKLTELSELCLDDCEALESLASSMGIHPTLPQSLERISAMNSPRLNGVPQFNSESALKYLDISQCTCVKEISGVSHCKNLKKLLCAETSISWLPDLSSLTRLKVLDMQGCELLTGMDNIKSLPSLKELSVDNCTSLLTLPDLGSSKGLTSLTLINCPLLDPNSVKLPTECSVDMGMENSADEQSDAECSGDMEMENAADEQADTECSVDMGMENVADEQVDTECSVDMGMENAADEQVDTECSVDMGMENAAEEQADTECSVDMGMENVADEQVDTECSVDMGMENAAEEQADTECSVDMGMENAAEEQADTECSVDMGMENVADEQVDTECSVDMGMENAAEEQADTECSVDMGMENAADEQADTECSVDMGMENAADEHPNSEVEGHECEDQTLAMDGQESGAARPLWRSASLLSLAAVSSVLLWTFGRKANKCRLRSPHEDERR